MSVAVAVSFIVSALACIGLARLAPYLRLIDLPDERKQHGRAVPLVGGIGILIGWLAGCLLGATPLPLDLLLPSLLLFALGLVDDIHALRASLKLVVQLAAAFLLIRLTGAALYAVPLPFAYGHWVLGPLALPVTVLMVVALINAINLIDGLDGLAGGCLAIASLGLAYAAAVVGRGELVAVALSLFAALLGFLLWNARLPWQGRARLFLGDAGALGVAMILCWLVFKLSMSFKVVRVPVTVALAPLAVPAIDMAVVAFWRMVEGRNPMQADRGHSHHLLLEKGLSSIAAVRLIWLASAAVTLATCVAWRLGVAEGRLLGVLLLGALAHLVWFRRSWRALRTKAATPKDAPPRVLFLVTGLGVGGAETALERLIPQLQAQGLVCAVASLRELGPLGERMRAAGIAVHALGMRPPRPSLAGLWRLRRLVRSFRPDILQGWMYHGNIAAHCAHLFAPQAQVLGAIHQSLGRPELDPWSTRAIIGLDALLSPRAASMIFVARSAVPQHIARGYCASNTRVLPNGFDLQRFVPDRAARETTRAQLGIGADEFLIGSVGRFHPVKDQAGFLRAAVSVAERFEQARFVMIGAGLDADNAELAPLASAPALQGRVQLLGARSDVASLMASFDLLVLSSLAEGLPNVVAEAMSCGVPCVVTDVGDAAWMVGDTGWVVAPGDAARLAAGIIEAINTPAEALQQRGRAARERVAAELSIEGVAAVYGQLYTQLRKAG